jgi:hypothetical protein
MRKFIFYIAFMLKSLRILILLFILLAVAVASWRTKANAVAWKYTLVVNVFPINGDGSAVTEAYLRGLTSDEFKPIEHFMQDEAARYGRASNASIEVRLKPELLTQPPAPPREGNVIETIFWSLKLRWWSYRHAEVKGPGPQVKLFLLYFDPARQTRLNHSTALQKGLIGRVNVFAAQQMAQQNNVIITHEFLHTLGATDKYDLSTALPLFPNGFAAPQQLPLYPQAFAEIMGGRVPLSASRARIPESLNEVTIGPATALEIRWLQ